MKLRIVYSTRTSYELFRFREGRDSVAKHSFFFSLDFSDQMTDLEAQEYVEQLCAGLALEEEVLNAKV